MDHSVFPPEILSLVIEHVIILCKKAKGMRLRCVNKFFDEEVLRLYFNVGYIDAKLQRANRPNDCQCRRAIRKPAAHKAMTEATVLRCITGLIEGNQLEAYDSRKYLQKQLRLARDFLMYYRASSTPTEFRLSQLGATRILAKAAISLLGVRESWIFFGPHHDCLTAATRSLRELGNPNLWAVIIAAYLNDLKLLSYLGTYLRLDRKAGTRNSIFVEDDVMGSLEQNTPAAVQQSIIKSVAVMTIAIRLRHKDILDGITMEEWEMLAKAHSACTKLYNRRTVVELAIEMGDFSLANKMLPASRSVPNNGLSRRWYTGALRAVAETSLDTPGRMDILKRLLQFDTIKNQNISSQLLHTAIYQGDLELAEFVLTSQRSTSSVNCWPSGDDWTDEYGVRGDRILDGGNVLEIAAAVNNLKMVKLVLKHFQASTGRDTVRVRTLRSYKKYKDREDSRRCVINRVFVDPNNRTPEATYRNPPDPEILREILKASRDLWLGGETTVAAGLQDPRILSALLEVVDLTVPCPESLNSDVTAVQTIGQTALLNALKTNRHDNAQMLIEGHGVKLSTDVFGGEYFHDDKEAVANMSKLKDLLRKHGVETQERTASLPHFFITTLHQ